jgi:hypothetical protein
MVEEIDGRDQRSVVSCHPELIVSSKVEARLVGGSDWKE